MSQRLFSVPKVGLFLDAYVPGVETRRGEETKILTLTLRVQPFDSKLATAIDDGLEDESGVRTGLFKLNHPDPKPHIDRLNFNLACPRQQMTIFASPDTDRSRMCFDQVKISGTYARRQKDVNGFAFVFKASFGPVGRDEQEFIHQWLLTQRFVSFEAAEPSMDFDDSADEGANEDDAPDPPTRRPKPMWDENTEQPAAAADAPIENDARKPKSHAAKDKRKKKDPETESATQRAEGRKRKGADPNDQATATA